MLQHLQLIKPKKVLQIRLLFAKLQNKHDIYIQQKHKESVLPTKRCFSFAFVSASLLTFGII